MSPTSHLLVAGTIGLGIYGVSGSWQGGIATVAAGVLPDADHLLDLYNWFVRRKTQRLLYLFHGWEHLVFLLALAATLSWPPLAVGIALGYASHILGDYLVNDRSALAYSILYRARCRFRCPELVPWYVVAWHHSQRPTTSVPSAVLLLKVLRWMVFRSMPFRHSDALAVKIWSQDRPPPGSFPSRSKQPCLGQKDRLHGQPPSPFPNRPQDIEL